MTEEKFMKELKRKLRSAKKNSEMTIDDVWSNMTKCAPVSSQNLRYLFAEKIFHVPKITTLKIVCDSLGITLAELFDDPMFNEQLTYRSEREVSAK